MEKIEALPLDPAVHAILITLADSNSACDQNK